MGINTITGETMGGYVLHRLRVGCALTDPSGRQVYFQPGDCTAGILDQWDAIRDEIPADKQAIITGMNFGDYFEGNQS